MEPCRTCGTPFAGDACPRCGVRRGVDAWNPTAPLPGVPAAPVHASPGPPAASGPTTPVSNWAPPAAASAFGTPPAPPVANPYAAPAANPYAPAPYAPPPAPAPRRHLPWITGVLAGLLVVGVTYLAIGGLVPKAGSASTAPSKTTTTKATASQSQSQSQSQPAATPAPTVSQGSTYPDVQVPAGAKECARVGTGAFDAVGTANASTSCPFAVNVRDAYIAAGLNGTPGHVTAHSPATNLDYDMTCSGTQPVLCTGGVAARVVIYGGRLVAG